MWQFIQILFLLTAGHSIADTALQKRSMGGGKSRHNPIDMSRVPKGQEPMNLWPMWLTHHAFIHGLVVTLLIYLVTQNIILSTNLGILETISHWIIDFFKCENKYNPYVDQILHLTMKLIYAIILIWR